MKKRIGIGIILFCVIPLICMDKNPDYADKKDEGYWLLHLLNIPFVQFLPIKPTFEYQDGPLKMFKEENARTNKEPWSQEGHGHSHLEPKAKTKISSKLDITSTTLSVRCKNFNKHSHRLYPIKLEIEPSGCAHINLMTLNILSSLLCQAVREQNGIKVQGLIAAGAQPALKPFGYNRSALECATQEGHAEMIKLF